MSFRLDILTPDGPAGEMDAESLVAPGLSGYFGILPGHAPLICGLGTGLLRVERVGEERLWVVDQGVLEVAEERVRVLADAIWPMRDELQAGEWMIQLKQRQPSALVKWMMR